LEYFVNERINYMFDGLLLATFNGNWSWYIRARHSEALQDIGSCSAWYSNLCVLKL